MQRIKFWLILLSIFLILLDKFSFISKIRDSSAVFIGKQVTLIKGRITTYPYLVFLEESKQHQLERENAQLKRQIEQYALMAKQEKNHRVNASELTMLTTSNQLLYNDFRVIVARAIIDVDYLLNNKILIDAGTTNGISVGSAVVNKDGVVGQIGISNDHNSQVILITNPNYKIYLENSASKSKMLAQGIANNTLLVKYINKNESLAIGNILVTTGLDNLYPANIPVARVTKVFAENNSFNSALCTPVVNFNNLQYVLVLKNAHK
jgi:rod shape-determining protein MreC